jgi:CRISPR-associated endonuclease/helicase Cas3
MSATLPRLDIFLDKDNSHLIKNIIQKEDFPEKFKAFECRTQIKTLNVRKKLEDSVIEKAKQLIVTNDKVLVVMNTIRSTQELYNELKNVSGVTTYLLNSTLLYPRRLEILEELSKTNGKQLLISTQSIEAGVDLDFNVGIREMSPPESIIQVMGRINRELTIQNKSSILYVTDKSPSLDKVYANYGLETYTKPEKLNDSNMMDKYLFDVVEKLRNIGTVSPTMLNDIRELKFKLAGQNKLIDNMNVFDIFFLGNVRIKKKYSIRKNEIKVGEKLERILNNSAFKNSYKIDKEYCLLNTIKFNKCYNKYMQRIVKLDYDKKFAELPKIKQLGYVWKMFSFSVKKSNIQENILEIDEYGRKWVTEDYYSFKNGLLNNIQFENLI